MKQSDYCWVTCAEVLVQNKISLPSREVYSVAKCVCLSYVNNLLVCCLVKPCFTQRKIQH